MTTDPPYGSPEFLRGLWAFSRPHTVIGTMTSLVSLHAVACAWTGGGYRGLGDLLVALLACLAANVYIVGLNQLTDVEIDRINKPDLPLASGLFSRERGITIVLVALAAALTVATLVGGYLRLTVWASVAIGTAYSLPPIRLKRFATLASASILVVRGLFVNVLLYLHMQVTLGGGTALPSHVIALTGFMFAFSLVIAWFKDIPDQTGDARFEISTFAVRLGPERMLALGQRVLHWSYGAMVFVALAGIGGVRPIRFALAHLALLGLARARGRRVDPTVPAAMSRYYLFIWGLFFAEYLLYPFLCRWH